MSIYPKTVWCGGGLVLSEIDLDPRIKRQLEDARTLAEDEFSRGLLPHIKISTGEMQQAKKIHADLSPELEFDEELMLREMVIHARQMQIMAGQPLPQMTTPSKHNSETPNFQKARNGANEVQVCCPKCGSTQLTAQKQGFGLAKAAVGGVLTGGVGLLAGFLGSRGVRVTCLKCGHSWKPGA